MNCLMLARDRHRPWFVGAGYLGVAPARGEPRNGHDHGLMLITAAIVMKGWFGGAMIHWIDHMD